jgi:hypothetical protein
MLDDSKSRLLRDATIAIVAALIGAVVGNRLQSHASKEQIYTQEMSLHHKEIAIKRRTDERKHWNVSFENACEGAVYVALGVSGQICGQRAPG